MLQEFADTLLAFTNYVGPDLNEDDLYILIGAGVESLQKAASVLLNYLYQNFIPKMLHPVVEESLQQLEEEVKEDIKEEEEKSKEEQEEHKRKMKLQQAFKNVSGKLLDVLDNPPSFKEEEEDMSELLQNKLEIEKLIGGSTAAAGHEGTMNSKTYGFLLVWNALLSKIEHGRIKAQMHGDYSHVLGALVDYLEENPELYQMLLVILIGFLPK